MKPFNLVLFAPEIPQNTGTIGRLCGSTETASGQAARLFARREAPEAGRNGLLAAP